MRERIDWPLVRLVLALMGFGLLFGGLISIASHLVPWWRWFY